MRASKAMQDRVLAHKNITVHFNTECTDASGIKKKKKLFLYVFIFTLETDLNDEFSFSWPQIFTGNSKGYLRTKLFPTLRNKLTLNYLLANFLKLSADFFDHSSSSILVEKPNLDQLRLGGFCLTYSTQFLQLHYYHCE